MTLIQLDDVGLKFQVRQCGRISFKEYLLHGMFRRSKKSTFAVQALENINLTVGEGEVVAVFGPRDETALAGESLVEAAQVEQRLGTELVARRLERPAAPPRKLASCDFASSSSMVFAVRWRMSRSKR